MILRLLLALSVITLRVCAQTPLEPTILPDGPLVRLQAPEFAEWVIEYQYSEKPPKTDPQKNPLSEMAARDPAVAALLKANPQIAGQMDPPRLTSVHVTRAGAVSHEELAYEGVGTEEHWFTGDYRLSRVAGGTKISAVAGAKSGGTDFPELSWISRENFAGQSKSAGRVTYTFQIETDPMRIEDPGMYEVLLERQRRQKSGPESAASPSGRQVRVVAVIDTETKLPVTLKIEKVSRVYKFLPTPAQTLNLPPEWVRAAREHQTAHRRMLKPVSPP